MTALSAQIENKKKNHNNNLGKQNLLAVQKHTQMESQWCSEATRGRLSTGLIHRNLELMILPTKENGHHHYICRICSSGKEEHMQTRQKLGI